MADATSARETGSKEGCVLAYDVKGSTSIYKGTLTSFSSGYLTSSSDTSGEPFAGVAYETVDNSSGANGDETSRVSKTGVHAFAKGSAAVADLGVEVYASDNQTVTTVAGNVKVGRIVEIRSSSSVGVKIDGYC